MRKLLLVVCVAMSQGCATIIASGPTDITIRSVPTEADVTVNGDSKGATPVTVPLHAEEDNLVTLSKEGCVTLSLIPRTSVGAGYVIADIFLPFGLIVDLITQEWQTFGEREITGHLSCTP